jgi:hypothetical protein
MFVKKRAKSRKLVYFHVEIWQKTLVSVLLKHARISNVGDFLQRIVSLYRDSLVKPVHDL